MNTRTKKRIYLATVGIVIVLEAGFLLFFAFSGPERIAASVIHDQATKAGLSRVEFGSMDIGPSGRFALENVTVSGGITAASRTIERIDVQAGSVRGRVSWLRLLTGPRESAKEDDRPIAAYLPYPLKILQLSDASLSLELKDGGLIRADGITAGLDRQSFEEMKLHLSTDTVRAGSGAIPGPIAVRDFNARMADRSLTIRNLVADGPWGEAGLRGRAENLPGLVRGVAESLRESREETGWVFLESFASLIDGLREEEFRFDIRFEPSAGLLPESLPADISIPGPPGIVLGVQSGEGDLLAGGEIRAGSVSLGGTVIGFREVPFELFNGRTTVGPFSPGVLFPGDGASTIFGATVSVTADLSDQDIPFAAAVQVPELLRAASILDRMAGEDRKRLPVLLSRLRGDAAADITATGTVQPFTLSAAAADVSADLAVHVKEGGNPGRISGRVQGSFDGKEILVRTDGLTLAGGDVAVHGGVVLDEWKPVELRGEFDLAEVRIDRDGPLGDLLPVKASGTVSAKGSIRGATDWRAVIEGEGEYRLEFDDIRHRERSTGPVIITGNSRWKYGRFFFEPFRVSISDGTVEGRIEWDGPRSPSSGKVGLAADFPSVKDLRPLLPELPEDIDGALHATVAGEGKLPPDPLGELRVSAALRGLTWDGILDGDEVNGEFLLDPDGLRVTDLQLRSKESVVTASGQFRPDQTYEAEVGAEFGDDVLERLAKRWPEFGKGVEEVLFEKGGGVSVGGRFVGTMDHFRGTATALVDDLRYGDILLPVARVEAEITPSAVEFPDVLVTAVLRSATGDLSSATSRVRGRGRLSLGDERGIEFRAETTPFDLGLLAPWVPPSARLSGMVTTSAEGRIGREVERLTIWAETSGARVAGATVQAATFGLGADRDRLRFHAAVTDASGGVFKIQGKADRGGPWGFMGFSDGVRLSTLPVLSERVEGMLTFSATAETPVGAWPLAGEIPDLRKLIAGLGMEATGAIRSASFARVRLGDLDFSASARDGAFDVEVLSASPRMEFHARGVSAEPRVRITGEWDEIDLGGLMQGKEGTAAELVQSGTCDLLWSLEDGIAGDIMSTEARLRVNGNTIVQREPCRIGLEPGRAFLDGLVLGSEEIPDMLLVAKGTVPFAPDDPRLDLELTLNDFDLAGLRLDREVFRNLSGICTLDGRVTGSLAEPDFLGRLRVSGGRFRLAEMEQSFSDISMEAVGTQESLRLEQFDARIGRGTVSASGEILRQRAGPPELDLAVSLRNVRYRYGRDLAVDLEGDLMISGPVDSSTLGGKVRVIRGSYTRPFDWTTIALVAAAGGSAPKSEAPPWNPFLDIEVTVPGNFWVRNSIVAAEFAGEAKAVGTRALPSLTGEIRALRGAFEANYATFRITNLVALFDESRPFSPYVTVQGETRLRGFVIRVRISGDEDSVEYEWSASPPLSEGQIVRLLTTGTVERGDAASTSASAAWILSQGLRYSASESASRTLPVESIDVRPVAGGDQDSEEVLVEARLTERFALRQFVDIKNPDNPATGAAYKLTEHVSLAGRVGWEQNYIVELIYEIFF